MSETNLFILGLAALTLIYRALNGTGKFARIKGFIYFYLRLSFLRAGLRANFGLNLSRDRLLRYGLFCSLRDRIKIAKKHYRLSFLPFIKCLNSAPVLDWMRILSKR